MQTAFGDYAISAEPELLVERGSTHTTGQADLLGVRLAVCSETDKGRRLAAAATVKRLTGGDMIRARRMRTTATDAYRSSSDVLGRFLEERCILSPAARVKARELFGSWSSWCHMNGEEVGTEKAFAEALSSRGFERKRSNGAVYLGLGLAAEDDQ